MKIGTKTILFGVHQFLIHPFFVYLAWLIIYRKPPNLVEMCAIVTHDLGYWGCPNIDGQEGEQHPARIAFWWKKHFGEFGRKVSYEILGHSRFHAKANNLELSKLFKADKLATTLYPRLLYIMLGTLSGEIIEYMKHAESGKYSDSMSGDSHKWVWIHEMYSHMASMGVSKNETDRRS